MTIFVNLINLLHYMSLSVCLSVACLDLARERKGRMEAHHTGNPWIYVEAKVKVTGSQSVKATAASTHYDKLHNSPSLRRSGHTVTADRNFCWRESIVSHVWRTGCQTLNRAYTATSVT